MTPIPAQAWIARLACRWPDGNDAASSLRLTEARSPTTVEQLLSWERRARRNHNDLATRIATTRLTCVSVCPPSGGLSGELRIGQNEAAAESAANYRRRDEELSCDEPRLFVLPFGTQKRIQFHSNALTLSANDLRRRIRLTRFDPPSSAWRSSKALESRGFSPSMRPSLQSPPAGGTNRQTPEGVGKAAAKASVFAIEAA